MTPSGSAQIRLIEMSVCLADASPLSESVAMAPIRHVPCPKSGYWFKALPIEGSLNGRHVDRFAFAAYPSIDGSFGKFTYIINEEGVLWRKDLGGKPIMFFPSDPRAGGWSKMD
jgi:hypothetical protein